VATLLLLDATRTCGALTSLLAAPPLVWLGLRSYSLYLWHWPVISLTAYAMFRYSPAERLPVQIGLSAAMMLVSYHMVERPMRKFLRRPDKRFLAYAGALVALAAIGLAGWQIRNYFYPNALGARLSRGGYLINPEGHLRVTLIGDSKGTMYATSLREAARRNGWRLRILAATGTNELPGEPETRWPEVRRWLDVEQPEVVIVSEEWKWKIGGGGSLRSLLEHLGRKQARVLILMQPPVPEVRYGRLARSAFATPLAPEPDLNARRLAANARLRTISARYGAAVIDPAPLFVDAQGQVRPIGDDGGVYYNDANHLSYAGAKLVMPRIEQAVAALTEE
jgi:hypothetical protein